MIDHINISKNCKYISSNYRLLLNWITAKYIIQNRTTTFSYNIYNAAKIINKLSQKNISKGAACRRANSTSRSSLCSSSATVPATGSAAHRVPALHFQKLDGEDISARLHRNRPYRRWSSLPSLGTTLVASSCRDSVQEDLPCWMQLHCILQYRKFAPPTPSRSLSMWNVIPLWKPLPRWLHTWFSSTRLARLHLRWG